MAHIGNRKKQQMDKKINDQRSGAQAKDEIQKQQSKQTPKGINPPPVDSTHVWTPSIHTAFRLIMAARLSSAMWSNISDCDETFNYLEPLHYLLHGHGMQTWEYSPAYAVRSYAYLWLYALPVKLLQTFYRGDKVLQFLILRCSMALVCSGCETYFYKTVRDRFGGNVSRLSLVFLIFSPGMFISSTAFLPSTFAMYTTMLALSFWFSRNSVFLPVFFVALGSLVGWPFAAALGIPIAYNLVMNQGRLVKFVFCSVTSLVVCLVPMVMVDSDYFGKLVVAPLNIITYNVFSDHGPDLYGVEPWTFYFVNGFLNFNLVFPLAVASLFLLIVQAVFSKNREADNGDWLCILGLHIWMLIFFTRPHKEERFLFPVYPLVCLSAAISVNIIQKFFHHQMKPSSPQKKMPHTNHHGHRVAHLMSASICVLFVVLSLSRILALHHGYHAPLKVYSNMNKVIVESPTYKSSRGQTLNICVGKEWYRFPSHFFLPERCQLKFIKSEFKGQLPREFSRGPNATREVPPNMNDLNLEETDRYVNPSSCQYLVDLDNGRSSEFEPNYSQQKQHWKVIISEKFIDASSSDRLFRAFYVPFVTSKHVKYGDYNVMVPVPKKKQL